MLKIIFAFIITIFICLSMYLNFIKSLNLFNLLKIMFKINKICTIYDLT